MALLGAHVSIAGGLDSAFEHGESIGCQAIQIFSKNQRQWRDDPLSDDAISRFRLRFNQSSIQSVIVHDSYLINLANPDRELLEKSRNAFQSEVRRAHQLGVQYLVLHPGSHLNSGEKVGIKRIAEGINRILDGMDDSEISVLFETTAGQGTSIGGKVAHLRDIIGSIHKRERVGICIDTAHIFAAGYDIRKIDEYEQLVRTFDRMIGLTFIRVFHLNDSKSEMGSRVDRHESIGKGQIGIKPFQYLINDDRFANCPMILETPGGPEQYKKDLKMLRSLMI